MEQSRYDLTCPDDFQSASYVCDHGQVDIVVSPTEGQKAEQVVDSTVLQVLQFLTGVKRANATLAAPGVQPLDGANTRFDYTMSRRIDRYQAHDIIQKVFENFVEIRGDGCIGTDPCIRGGFAFFQGNPCMVLGTFKGHTPGDMQKANYGMASPHGYRTALRMMRLAERFRLPVVTLVDTCGAWPSFEVSSSCLLSHVDHYTFSV
jgi:acetyl-CoA carboxylase alpha subunit